MLAANWPLALPSQRESGPSNRPLRLWLMAPSQKMSARSSPPPEKWPATGRYSPFTFWVVSVKPGASLEERRQ